MYYKVFTIHLVDGKSFEYLEDNDMSKDYSFISRFIKADPDHIFIIPDFFHQKAYIHKRSIAYITLDGTREIRHCKYGD